MSKLYRDVLALIEAAEYAVNYVDSPNAYEILTDALKPFSRIKSEEDFSMLEGDIEGGR